MKANYKKHRSLPRDMTKEYYIDGYNTIGMIVLVRGFGWGKTSVAGRRLKIDRFYALSKQTFYHYDETFRNESIDTKLRVIENRASQYGVELIPQKHLNTLSYHERLVYVICMSQLEVLVAHFNFREDELQKYYNLFVKETNNYSEYYKREKRNVMDYLKREAHSLGISPTEFEITSLADVYKQLG